MNFPMHHSAIDRRSLMMHRIIAERLRANPALLEIPRGNLARLNCPESRDCGSPFGANRAVAFVIARVATVFPLPAPRLHATL